MYCLWHRKGVRHIVSAKEGNSKYFDVLNVWIKGFISQQLDCIWQLNPIGISQEHLPDFPLVPFKGPSSWIWQPLVVETHIVKFYIIALTIISSPEVCCVTYIYIYTYIYKIPSVVFGGFFVFFFQKSAVVAKQKLFILPIYWSIPGYCGNTVEQHWCTNGADPAQYLTPHFKNRDINALALLYTLSIFIHIRNQK